MRPSFPLLICALPTLLAAGLLMLVAGCDKPVAKPPEIKPQEVLYVTPVTREVTEFEEFTGRTSAENMVDIRSRVSGYLMEGPKQKGAIIPADAQVKVVEGAEVKVGDVLFTIDARPFEAELARAKANVKGFEARRDRLVLQAKRAETLIEKDAISQDEFETILFNRDEAEA